MLHSSTILHTLIVGCAILALSACQPKSNNTAKGNSATKSVSGKKAVAKKKAVPTKPKKGKKVTKECSTAASDKNSDQARANSKSDDKRVNAIIEEKMADTSPLPKGVWIRFQTIKLAGKGGGSNSRFMLYSDGRFFSQENSNKDDLSKRPAGSAFNKVFPSKPKKKLDKKALELVDAALKKHGFATLPNSIMPKGKVKGGSIQIIEVREGKKIKRVANLQNASKAIEAIVEAIEAQVN